MTEEAFIEKLDNKGYPYEIEGDKVVVTSNNGYVDLNSLTSLSPGVEFKNGGDVELNSLASIPPDVVFRNRGYVNLRSLTSIPPGVKFRNGGNVYLGSLLGDWFVNWKGNIEGIGTNRLLNKMISIGLFDR